jgi:uncharacterized protein (UPF0147 family)
MELPNFSIEDLKRLPLRAMIAFAARCARRVEHLAQLPEGHPGKEERRGAIDAALRLAEDVARGEASQAADSVVQAIDVSRRAASAAPNCASAAAAAAQAAHAAASVLSVIDRVVEDQDMPQSARTAEAREFLGSLERSTVDLAALSAYTAAVDAFDAVGLANEDFVAASLNDYDNLRRLNLGQYPQPGEPIDPSPSGPLGAI